MEVRRKRLSGSYRQTNRIRLEEKWQSISNWIRSQGAKEPSDDKRLAWPKLEVEQLLARGYVVCRKLFGLPLSSFQGKSEFNSVRNLPNQHMIRLKLSNFSVLNPICQFTSFHESVTKKCFLPLQ